MDSFDNIGPLAAALAKAQAAYPPIPRDREVEVQTRTGGKYKFKYAPLDTILNAVRKPLSDNGLAITQLLDGGHLTTVLFHETGAYLSASMPLPNGDGSPQSLGSAITYLRRYSLQAMLGIAAEEDDDAQAAKADGVTTTPRQQQRPARLAEVVASRLPEPRGEPPAPAPVPEAAPAAEAAPEGTEAAPEASGEPDLVAMAKEVFGDDIVQPPGLSMDELKKMMKEQRIFSGQMVDLAAKHGYEGRVQDLTDAQRYDLWNVAMRELRPA